MRRKGIVLLLIIVLVLVACSAKVKWEPTLKVAPLYKADVAYPIVVHVSENGEAFTGLTIHATLEMDAMDHGKIEVDLLDQGNGDYKGEVALSMSGTWIGLFELSDGKQKLEKLITFTVQGE